MKTPKFNVKELSMEFTLGANEVNDFLELLNKVTGITQRQLIKSSIPWVKWKCVVTFDNKEHLNAFYNSLGSVQSVKCNIKFLPFKTLSLKYLVKARYFSLFNNRLNNC